MINDNNDNRKDNDNNNENNYNNMNMDMNMNNMNSDAGKKTLSIISIIISILKSLCEDLTFQRQTYLDRPELLR